MEVPFPCLWVLFCGIRCREPGHSRYPGEGTDSAQKTAADVAIAAVGVDDVRKGHEIARDVSGED